MHVFTGRFSQGDVELETSHHTTQHYSIHTKLKSGQTQNNRLLRSTDTDTDVESIRKTKCGSR